MKRVLMRSVLVIPMLLAVGSVGSCGDILEPIPSTENPDGFVKTDAGCVVPIPAPPTRLVVEFAHDAPIEGGLICERLARTASTGILTLDGTQIALGNIPNQGVTITCSVKSAAFTLPANAKRIDLKFKTHHDFLAYCVGTCMVPKITWGTIQLIDPVSKQPIDLQPSFHQPVPPSNEYEFTMGIPSSTVSRSFIVNVAMTGFGYNWGVMERFSNFSWTLNDMAFEITN